MRALVLKCGILLLICHLFTIDLWGQSVDSLQEDRIHAFRLSALAAPVSLTGIGVAVSFVPEIRECNFEMRSWIQDLFDVNTTADNYLQFAPLACLCVLNVCDVPGVHRIGDLGAISAISYLLGIGVNSSLKSLTNVKRPDGTSYNSFPSGHTMTAFVGAELLRREYGEQYPLVAVFGYSAAFTTGLFRILNNRHWLGDVAAGAGVGIMSASAAYWLYPHVRSLLGLSEDCKGFVSCSRDGVAFTASMPLTRNDTHAAPCHALSGE